MTEVQEAKRQEIKDRITAAQERNEARREPTFGEQVNEKAIAAKDGFTSFAIEHTVATIAGGIAIGVLISALFKNSPTRKAGRVAGTKAAGLATMGSEMAAAFAQQVMENSAGARQAGSDRLEDIGDAVGDKTRHLRREAHYRYDGARDIAHSMARDIGKIIARSLRRD